MKKDKRASRTVIQEIADFPLTKEMEKDEFGEFKSGSSSYGVGYSAWYIQQLARKWLKDNPRRS